MGGKLTLCLALIVLTPIFCQKEKDSTKKATEQLPLEPEQKIAFTTDKGTWMFMG